MNGKTTTKSLTKGMRFNNLVLIDEPGGWSDLVQWQCDCGKTTFKTVGRVISNQTKTCGKCKEVSAEEMAVRRFGKLRLKFPQVVTTGSAKKLTWMCECGNETCVFTYSVFNGETQSCNHCNDIPIESVFNRKFGKLSLIDAKGVIKISPESHKRLEWKCDCGRTSVKKARYVLNGTIKSCGSCNEIGLERLAGSFGRLRMKNPQNLKTGSNKKVLWVCSCGNETYAVFFRVVNGFTKSCGRCGDQIKRVYEENRESIRQLRTPIHPEQIPDGCPKALEVIKSTKKTFRAVCPLCQKEYHPRWSGIRLGISLTCGCSINRVSNGQKQIHSFITSLGIEAKLEHRIQLVYDVWVPSKNLVIEFNGLRWHSRKNSKHRDIEKWKNAIVNGCSYLMIFEDEWENNQEKVKNLIRNRLGVNSFKGIRPSQCEIRQISSKESDTFYEKFHYIGRTMAPVNYGVFFEERLVACASFKRPTRQSKHSWELTRMVADPGVKVYGIWSKILKLFIKENYPSSIVSFSDNRLFDGQVYEKLGFRHDGDVKPDYYWVKNNKRHHKSSLRKTKEEKSGKLTETELREAQGYSKIWDLGKKRWVIP